MGILQPPFPEVFWVNGTIVKTYSLRSRPLLFLAAYLPDHHRLANSQQSSTASSLKHPALDVSYENGRSTLALERTHLNIRIEVFPRH